MDSSSLVPAAAQNPYDITPAVWFVDALGNQVQLTQDPVSFTLLNQVPVVSNDAFTIAEDSRDQVLDVLSNDSDADNGQQLTLISLQTAGLQGTALISSDETNILFTPAADLFGEQTLSYLVADTAGAQVSGNVTITITPMDDAPVAVADTLQVTEDSSALVNVINNDYDADNPGEALVIVNATVSTGTVTVEGDSLRYTPNPDFAGNTVIHYDVQDTTGRATGGQVNVTVANINDAPVVVDDTAVAIEDTLMILDILANDIDADNDILQLTNLSSAQGQASVSQGGKLRFMPSQDFNGPATISYMVSDGVGGKTAAQLHFAVTPVNDAPVLSPIPVTTFVNEPVIIDVFAHTIDVDGDTLQLPSSSATNGVISTGAGGRLTFTPLTDFDGPAEARVCVSDGTEQSCGVWNITVTVPNTAPVLQDLTVEIGEDQSITMALHGVDADGDLLTYTLLTEPKGKLAGNMPVSTYTPPQNFDGEDHFTYVASDGQYSSNEATVTIVIGSENDAPLAIDDVVLTDAYGQQTIDVLANDSDPEDDKLTIVGATASLGTVSWSESQLFYSPVAGFVGTTVLTYTIKDTAGQSASARVMVTVEPASNGLLPVIKVPADITIDADALFTKVDLGMASAVDRFGNPLPVSLMGGSSFYEPGMNIAYWVALDKEGRQSIASQRVRINPMVSLGKDQKVLEGHSASVSVHLNGAAPAYPLVIPYQVSGTATAHDHDLISGEVVIESGTTGTLRFTAFADEIEDANETIVVSLSDNLNRSNQFEQVIQIAETNIDPAFTLRTVQQGEERLVVSRQGGPVQINALIQLPEADNAHEYAWLAQETKLIDIDDSPASFTFEPATLATGFYEVSLQVTDSADNAFGATGNIVLQVVEGFKKLTGVDSDQDGISDELEGYRDHNFNGIADFVDRLSNCSVLPQNIAVLKQYLLQTDPGVCLRLGKTARMGQTGGAQVLEQDIGALNDLIADAIAQNMGGLFDFVAYGLPRKGQVVNIVIPQLRPVPENAVYRKYKHQQLWFDFVQDDHNRVWSAAGEPGYCPAPGSEAWVPGLTAGHWCVQLTIMDGGPNDADGIANTTVVDPGGVGVVIGDPNMLPETNEDRYEVLLTKSAQFTPLSNDTDANGDALMITSASASFGEVTFNNDKVFYTPPAGFVGNVEITYGVADERGGTAAGMMSIEIVANKAPLVINETAEVASGSRITVNVLSNDSDPDGDALTVVSAQAQSGTVFILDSGALEYVPRADFTGQDKITYIVADTNFAEAQGQLTVTVHPVAVRVEIKGGGAVVGLLLLMLGVAGGRQAERAWSRSRP
ncbi:tandem-95 repeat protein [Salinimonas marina]|uniref:Tandem-95 repeat protein n=1 Tax=Salinimonas marina TaxID=2785918 RepID=A0A7S9DYV1_9ALTE|nr:Ig-like domain-containing protein [Salinimonas marina]QPG06138.1 tandem-95 repeat protein [Salinimonas marina]